MPEPLELEHRLLFSGELCLPEALCQAKMLFSFKFKQANGLKVVFCFVTLNALVILKGYLTGSL